MNQLFNDLCVVFGFSRANATKAERLWRERRLPVEFQYIMQSLYDRPWTCMNSTDLRSAPYNKFNQLNYKLTVEEL